MVACISGVTATPTIARGRISRTGGLGFVVSEVSTAPTDAAGGVPPSAAPASLGGMLALQEVELTRRDNRAARQHVESMLEGLARLQATLLLPASGARLEEAALFQLADLAACVPTTSEPALAEALEAITLRTKVELAKRDHHP